MELAQSCTLPRECLKEKGSQSRRWNARRTGSRTSLFHPRNLHGLKWKSGCWRRELVLVEVCGGRDSLGIYAGRSERQ